ncbi:MAG TPA: TIGR02757 family protein [Thermoanaerobaculia bacterium]|nr:TIGR02757 family protein [Thermoanaerobaculia bacterium]
MRPLGTSAALLGERLEALYRLYGPETVATDPILFPRRYDTPEDREVAGWIASAFAYGQVSTIQASVGRLLDALGQRPAAGLDAIRDFRGFAREALAGFRHRFHGARDAAALLYAIARVRDEAGSVRAVFEGEFREEEPDVGGLVSRVVARLLALDYRPVLGRRTPPSRSPVRFFFPDPADGSACKRWNLYLRWMVRRDAVDFGLWPGIPTDRLIVPTDTHVHRIARRLRLTRRKTADWTAAREITQSLSRFDSRDPVRYDYALCRIGILDICRPLPSRSLCEDCPVQDPCSIGRRRAPRAADGGEARLAS